MYAVINEQGFFISQLHNPDDLNLARSDVVVAPDAENLTTNHRLVDGVWIAPAPVEPEIQEGFAVMRRPDVI